MPDLEPHAGPLASGHAPRLRARGGNFAVLFGVSLIAILGFAALVIDVSYLRLAALQAQNAADAAAHAGLVSLRMERDEAAAEDVAEAVLNMNVVAGQVVHVDTQTFIDFGQWDFNSRSFDTLADYNNAIQVTVARNQGSADGAVGLLIAPIWGRMTGNVWAQATSALRSREVMFAIDISESFRDEPDAGIYQFSYARTAVLDFLEEMYNGGSPFPGDQIGLVAFAGDVQLFTELQLVSDNYDSIVTQWETELDWCDLTALSEFSYAAAGLPYHPAPAMLECCDHPSGSWCPGSSGGTDIGSGINEAVPEFSAPGTSEAVRTLILISDGEPQCPGTNSAACRALLRAGAQNAADSAWAREISVYAVGYNPGGDPSFASFLEGLTRGEGDFSESPDPSDLPLLLAEIADDIPIALVQ